MDPGAGYMRANATGRIHESLKSKNMDTIVDKYGSVDDDSPTSNWMRADEVLKCIHSYDRIHSRRAISIVINPRQPPNEDVILIIPYLTHLFVGLYISARNKIYILRRRKFPNES